MELHLGHPDYEVVRRLLEGIDQDWDRWLEKFRRWARESPNLHSQDQEDVVADACARVQKGLPGFRGRKPDGGIARLAAWMWAVFWSARQDWWRKRSRQKRALSRVAASLPNPGVAGAQPALSRDPLPELALAQTNDVVRREIDRIVARARKPDQLREIVEGLKSGLQQREIARKLGISEHAVNCAVSRLRKKLKERLAEEGILLPWSQDPAPGNDPRAGEEGREEIEPVEGSRGSRASNEDEPGASPGVRHDL